MVIHGDCLSELNKMDDNSIDVVVTSPPYNKGFWSANRNMNNGFKTKSRRIEYGTYNDCMKPEDYSEWQTSILTELIRVIKPTGSIFYNTIDILNNHQSHHALFVWKFPVKQVIVWNRKNTPKLDKSYFFPVTENIFWIQKTTKARTLFDRKKAIFKTNVWELSPDTKNKFPAPYPVELPLNCIKTCCPENGIVLDPFCGSGTTGVAAKMCGVNFIGIEIHKEFCELAEKRISEV